MVGTPRRLPSWYRQRRVLVGSRRYLRRWLLDLLRHAGGDAGWRVQLSRPENRWWDADRRAIARRGQVSSTGAAGNIGWRSPCDLTAVGCAAGVINRTYQLGFDPVRSGADARHQRQLPFNSVADLIIYATRQPCPSLQGVTARHRIHLRTSADGVIAHSDTDLRGRQSSDGVAASLAASECGHAEWCSRDRGNAARLSTGGAVRDQFPPNDQRRSSTSSQARYCSKPRACRRRTSGASAICEEHK